MVSHDRGALSVRHACELVEINRSWFYAKPERRSTEDVDLQDEIGKIVLEYPGHGYRRVTREFTRRGYRVNRERVLRIMRQGDWLCRVRRRGNRTTDSDHGLALYPNLLKDRAITGLDRVWVADITYIRLSHEFVDLAVILDAYSRGAIGWELSRSLETSLTLAALERALRSRTIQPALVHHSDQGVQYASESYVRRAREAGLPLSMGRRGQPTDNPQAEAFFRPLKVKQVYLTEYLDFEDAYRQIRRFIERIYNRKRLHSSLGYVPPVEFEEKLRAKPKRRSTSVTRPSAPLTRSPVAPAPT
jgi:putative transposase